MAANQVSNSLLKVTQFAKDLNMKTKDVVAILEEKGVAVKSQKPMDPSEFELLFEALTKANQITNIEDYLDGVTYIPSKKKAASTAKDSWRCACGTENTGKFCSECGTRKPAPAGVWRCACGTENTGKFCSECGAKRPETGSWTCACGAENTGKFCAECGSPKP